MEIITKVNADVALDKLEEEIKRGGNGYATVKVALLRMAAQAIRQQKEQLEQSQERKEIA